MAFKRSNNDIGPGAGSAMITTCLECKTGIISGVFYNKKWAGSYIEAKQMLSKAEVKHLKECKRDRS